MGGIEGQRKGEVERKERNFSYYVFDTFTYGITFHLIASI